MNKAAPPTDQRPLRRRFFRCGARRLARCLLGRTLLRTLEDGTRLAGRIIETEAYLGRHDKAAHSYRGRRTQRNESMYDEGGHAYVYFTYGMHHCMNVVAGREGLPVACLVRALEPLEGIERMRAHRAGRISAERLKDTDLCSGPAKLCQALAIDRDLDGHDLVGSSRLTVLPGRPVPDKDVETGPRVGVAYAEEWAHKPLRFYLRDHRHVSRR